MTNTVQAAVGRLAAAQRWGKSKADIAEARNSLAAAHLERAIMAAVKPTDKGYKPLRAEDRERLAALLLEG